MSTKNRWRKSLFDMHSALGVTLGIAFFAAAFSGTVALFSEELMGWEYPVFSSCEKADSTLQQNVDALRAHVGDTESLVVFLPDDHQQCYTAQLSDETRWNGLHWYVLDPSAPSATTHLLSGAAWFLQRMHTNFVMQSVIGRYLVGLVGVLFLISTLAGLLMHVRIREQLFTLNSGGSDRKVAADLHKAMGVWGLPFHLVMGLTGALIGLAGIVTSIVALTAFDGDREAAVASVLGPPAENTGQPAEMADLDAVMTLAEQQVPGGTPRWMFIEHLDDAGARVQISLTRGDRLGDGATVFFEGASGRFLRRVDLSEGSVYEQIYGAVAPLHYATFGGTPLKLLYFVLGLMMCVLIGSGLRVWAARRTQGSAQVRALWPKLSSGGLAGIVVATLGLLAARPVFPIDADPFLTSAVVYFSLWLTTVGVAVWAGGDQWSFVRRCASVCALLALVAPATHWLFLKGAGAPLSESALTVDVLLWFSAAALALFAWRGNRGTTRPKRKTAPSAVTTAIVLALTVQVSWLATQSAAQAPERDQESEEPSTPPRAPDEEGEEPIPPRVPDQDDSVSHTPDEPRRDPDTASPPSASSGPQARPAVVPPKSLAPLTLMYPAAARERGVAADVVLRVTIDVTGTVVAAEVVDVLLLYADGSEVELAIMRQAFGEAARMAAFDATFSPALKDGAPVKARILLPHEFRPEPAQDDQVIDVMVRDPETEAERLRRSAEAVTVVDLEEARTRSSDLGELLARTQGASLRRTAGLGSFSLFSLNGLTENQIPFFVDGVPLEQTGLPVVGAADVPVNLVNRVELYRGVVPIRFGFDALGGAVNLVTEEKFETAASASYQVGSFNTHRVTAAGTYHHERSGFVARGITYFDTTDNDYLIDVEVPDDVGRLQPARVRRFHDGFRAYFGSLQLGLVDRGRIRKLLFRGFYGQGDKDIQHNVVMTVPYGEARFSSKSVGGNVSYLHSLTDKVDFGIIANYSYRTIDTLDVSEFVYDWFGNRIRERPVPGEIDIRPIDDRLRQNDVYTRSTVDYTVRPDHILRFAGTLNFSARTGDDRTVTDPTVRDPLNAQRNLLRFVAGAEYELNAVPVADAPKKVALRRPGTDYKIQNIVLLKSYLYRAQLEESLAGGLFRDLDRNSLDFGIGNAFRYRPVDWLYLKASYEFATRLPSPDEVFGDGVLILPNLELVPEVSHNFNLGPRVELEDTPVGEFNLDMNFFWRRTENQIVLLGNEQFQSFQNVFAARSVGIEGTVLWESVDSWLTLDTTVTYQAVRNISDEGAFAPFRGDRIPNRPYFFGNWGAKFSLDEVLPSHSGLRFFYIGRFVREFFRAWESQGLRQFKQTIDDQLSHLVGATYVFTKDPGTVSATFEIQNITNAALFDSFGVQRPGRAYYFKVAGSI